MEKKKLCADCGAEMNRHSKICRGCYLKAVEKDPEEKRVKHNAYQRKWTADHQERAREIARVAMRKYLAANPEKSHAQQKYHRQKVRAELMELLGGIVCVRCGFNDVRALQIDHINGDGIHDRIRPADLWRRRDEFRASPDEARQKYQVLCANCNWIKRAERGEVGMKYRKKE